MQTEDGADVLQNEVTEDGTEETTEAFTQTEDGTEETERTTEETTETFTQTLHPEVQVRHKTVKEFKHKYWAGSGC